jgi:hypothetical protein
VQEPLVGVVGEYEARKGKMRVLQVERGVLSEVSYRCEDLKRGKIVVSAFLGVDGTRADAV